MRGTDVRGGNRGSGGSDENPGEGFHTYTLDWVRYYEREK